MSVSDEHNYKTFTKSPPASLSQVYVPQNIRKIYFFIKSQEQVSDENFLYHCIHLARKISSYGI